MTDLQEGAARNIVLILQKQIAARPDAPALIDVARGRDRITTFQDLDEQSQRVAGWLHLAGLKQGDAVLLLQPLSSELYVALLAVLRLGLVAMFLDPSAGRKHVARCLQIGAPRAFIGSPRAQLLRLLFSALRRVPSLVVGAGFPGAMSWQRVLAQAPRAEIAPCAGDDAALLTFTSGTTGEPKAAVRTHDFLRAQHEVLRRHLSLRSGERDLATLPIFVLANLGSGAASVLADANLRRPDRIDAARLWRQVERTRANRLTASPAVLERLCEYSRRASKTLKGIETIHTGGGPVFPALLKRAQSMAPRAQIAAVYGSTEAEPIAILKARDLSDDDEAASRSGAGLPAGKVVPEIELRIISDNGGAPLSFVGEAMWNALQRPRGASGEIVVCGEHVLRSYANGASDAETKIRVGDAVWHRTGDAGWLDERGRLWLLGRCTARIEDERGTLYPLAVEAAVADNDLVRRAALVSHCGKRILVVEPRDRKARRVLLRGEAKRLQNALSWAHIDAVRVLARLPVDSRHNAKIDYAALRRRLK